MEKEKKDDSPEKKTKTKNNKSGKKVISKKLIAIISVVVIVLLVLIVGLSYKKNIMLNNACKIANNGEYIVTNKNDSKIICYDNTCTYYANGKKEQIMFCGGDTKDKNSNTSIYSIFLKWFSKIAKFNNNTNTNSNTNSNTNTNTNTNSNTNTNTNTNTNSNTNTQTNENQSAISQNSAVKEKIKQAYSTASRKNNGSVTTENLKNELASAFGTEGVGYKIIDNGVAWLIEVPSQEAAEIINKSGNIEDYIIPEKDCGAKGDGVTDDTQAIKRCMQSSVKNVVLTGKYLIKSNITSTLEKNIFKGTLLCELTGAETKQQVAFTFSNNIRFNNTTFKSSVKTTGRSPHGETFQSSSNIDFVDVWGNEARFVDCTFENALRAVRGRKSSSSTNIPQNLYVNNSSFIDCKAPVQGFFAVANVENSSFKNNGDLYSGDHAIYLESYGQRELNIRNCNVETLNTESGPAFQVYGKQSNQTTTPTINISNCNINANGVISSDLANATITNTKFTSNMASRAAFRVEDGSVLIDGCDINHSILISSLFPNITVTAKNSTFRIQDLSTGRAFFPTRSTNVKFVNWGGTVMYTDTRIDDCVFTRDKNNVVGKYYIGISKGYKVTITNTAFKSGDNISYNSAGTIYLKNSYYTNKIGTNVPNVIEEGTIARDIVS